ncbi:MAG: hypothetical protein IJW38_04160 [Clostridia bacterium]|nr:hypothetical protein [Clostridia bacterium]
MKKYEEFIKNYVESNADVLNKKASSNKRLLKFSEAVTRAITEKKKSDTGYGDIAESLASLGLSGSGYADYLRERGNKLSLNEIQDAADQKNLWEARDELELREETERLENERLEEEKKEEERAEKEKLAAEKKEKERLEKEAKELEKNKNTVLSFAAANNVVDFSILYDYAISLGLPENEAKAVAEAGTSRVKEKIRNKNIEKTREVIISERLTENQAYTYAKNLGLDENDAKELAEFAYKMNQDTDHIIGGNDTVGGGGNAQVHRPPRKEFSQTIFN